MTIISRHCQGIQSSTSRKITWLLLIDIVRVFDLQHPGKGSVASPFQHKVTMHMPHEYLFPFVQPDSDTTATLATQQKVSAGLQIDTGQGPIGTTHAFSPLNSEVHVVVCLVCVWHAAEIRGEFGSGQDSK